MVHNLITGAPAWSPMGSTANIAGRSAAVNLAGGESEYLGVLGTAVCKLPGLNAGRTGMSVPSRRCRHRRRERGVRAGRQGPLLPRLRRVYHQAGGRP